MERLQKVMAERGIASRRKCEELILAGKVCVNGNLVKELGTKVDPFSAIIEVDGRSYQAEEKVYYLLYKPIGVITSVSDPEGRKTVLDLLKNVKVRVYPVGRLDYDTEGLLLLTNDGELANRIMHPRYVIDKEYQVLVRGKPSEESIQALMNGVQLEDGITAPANAKLIRTNEKGNSWITLIIHEGRNRQVRRMCEKIGHPVLSLQRVRLGFLTLKGLKVGEFRSLSDQEVIKLREFLELT